MVKKVILNCKKLLEREQAHMYLAQMLNFPDYYGKNLDALYDCLMEMGECTIVLEGEDALRQSNGYGARVLKVLEDAAQADFGLRLKFQEVEEDEPETEY